MYVLCFKGIQPKGKCICPHEALVSLVSGIVPHSYEFAETEGMLLSHNDCSTNELGLHVRGSIGSFPQTPIGLPPNQRPQLGCRKGQVSGKLSTIVPTISKGKQGLLLEVVPEGPISKHLEEGVVVHVLAALA